MAGAGDHSRAHWNVWKWPARDSWGASTQRGNRSRHQTTACSARPSRPRSDLMLADLQAVDEHRESPRDPRRAHHLPTSSRVSLLTQPNCGTVQRMSDAHNRNPGRGHSTCTATDCVMSSSMLTVATWWRTSRSAPAPARRRAGAFCSLERITECAEPGSESARDCTRSN